MSMATAMGSAGARRPAWQTPFPCSRASPWARPGPGGGDGVQRALHHGGVGAIAGEGGDARLGAGGHQNVVVGQIVVFIPHSGASWPPRGRRRWGGKLPPEQGEGGVDGRIFADGVHVDAHLLPLLIVAQHGGGGTPCRRGRAPGCGRPCRCTRDMPLQYGPLHSRAFLRISL